MHLINLIFIYFVSNVPRNGALKIRFHVLCGIHVKGFTCTNTETFGILFQKARMHTAAGGAIALARAKARKVRGTWGWVHAAQQRRRSYRARIITTSVRVFHAGVSLVFARAGGVALPARNGALFFQLVHTRSPPISSLKACRESLAVFVHHFLRADYEHA